MNSYRVWLNAERTVLLRMWDSGTVEVCTRETPDHIWGPPVYLNPEPLTASAASGDPVARETTPPTPASEQSRRTP